MRFIAPVRMPPLFSSATAPAARRPACPQVRAFMVHPRTWPTARAVRAGGVAARGRAGGRAAPVRRPTPLFTPAPAPLPALRRRASAAPPPAAATTSAPSTPPPLVRLVALCPSGVPSPVAKGEATWAAVLAHEGVRLAWADAAVGLTVYEDESTSSAAWDAALAGADGVIVAAVPDEGPVGAAARALLARPSLSVLPTVAPLGCGPALTAALWRAGGTRAYPTSPLGRALAALPWSRAAAVRAAAGIAAGLWARSHSDDALAALAVVLDASGIPQPSVEALKGRGPCTLFCMLRHCREQVLACVTDPTCKAGLDALAAAPPGDAVGKRWRERERERERGRGWRADPSGWPRRRRERERRPLSLSTPDQGQPPSHSTRAPSPLQFSQPPTAPSLPTSATPSPTFRCASCRSTGAWA